MNLFAWLFLGHLAGDWLLQNDWMARNKTRRLFGAALLVHCALYTAVLVGCLALAGELSIELGPMTGFVGAVYGSHWLIDGLGLAAGWSRLVRQTTLPLVRIMVDQTLHLWVLGVLALWVGGS
jgi:hypothetical protein